jgi:hypothetical protein
VGEGSASRSTGGTPGHYRQLNRQFPQPFAKFLPRNYYCFRCRGLSVTRKQKKQQPKMPVFRMVKACLSHWWKIPVTSRLATCTPSIAHNFSRQLDRSQHQGQA